MPYQTRLPDVLASFGLIVDTVPGWNVRGSEAFAPRGAVSHWTAGPRGTSRRPSLNICVNGRPGIPGPLCNVYLDRAGIAVVVAAGTANHAGVGGWKGLTGNSQVFGTEGESGGDGDWTAEQRWAYPRINAAFCKLGSFGPDMVCGHNEWAPTRKIDIRDWPMPVMRQQVAAVLAGTIDDGGFLMALSDAEQREVLSLCRRIRGEDANADMLQLIRQSADDVWRRVRGGHPDMDSLQALAYGQAQLAAAMGALASTDRATVAAVLVDAIPATIAQDVVDLLGQRIASTK